MNLVYRSTVASLVVQLLVGCVTALGFLFQPPDDVRDDLRLILSLELASQAIEFVWYFVVVCRYSDIVTWTRYIDWVVSTPTMLLSTIFFLRHRGGESLLEPFQRSPLLYVCLILNWWMLLFGFLAETGRIQMLAGLSLGGVGFVGSFTALATFVETTDALSNGLFWVMYTVWGLYGVFAALAHVPKNVGYNVLDIVSKNFYGVFLFAYLLTL